MRSISSLAFVAAFATSASPAPAQSAPLLRELRRTVPPERPGTGSQWQYRVDVSFADLDGDGDLDTVLDGRVLLNDGNGAFTNAASVPLAANETDLQAHLVDVDSDGDADVIQTVYAQPQDLLKVWLNDGQASFTSAGPAFVIPGYAYAGRFDAGDIEGDGDVDILLPRHDDLDFDLATLLLNDGFGGFTDASSSIAHLNLWDHCAVRLVDLDADGDLDLFADGDPSYNEGGVADKIAVNSGTGVFTLLTGYLPTVSSNVNSLVIVDVDGDLDLDLWPAAGTLLLNDGANQFTPALGVPALPELTRIHAAFDIDGDGDVDAMVSSHYETAVLFNDGTTNFTLGQERWPGSIPYGAPLDVDGDGDLDYFHRDGVLFNPGDGAFVWPADTAVGYGVGIGGVSDAITLVDLDGDHQPEVFGSGGLVPTLFRNTGTTALAQLANTGLDEERHYYFDFADLDLDGDDDFIAVSQLSGLQALLNDGSGSFTSGPVFPAHSSTGAVAVVAGDLDGDGDVDFVGGTYPPIVWLNDGSAHFSELAGAWPTVVGLGARFSPGDLDGDGDLDLLVASWSAGVGVLFNDGSGSFAHAGFVLTGGNFEAYVAHAGDVDGDGDIDAVVSGYPATAGSTRLALNDGLGTFSESLSLPPVASTRATVALVDIDADLDLDLVLHGYEELAFALNDGHGQFVDAGALTSAPYHVSPDSFADVDFDGDVDAIAIGRSGTCVLANITRQVAWRTPPRIGRTLELELHGPADRFFKLYGSLGRAFRPFGEHGTLMVDTSQLVYEVLGRYDANGFALATRDIPNDLALVGLDVYWQTYTAARRRFSNLEITGIENY